MCGVSFAWYLLSYPDTQGVSVIRMEGTMVTGEAYDAETIGSEVVGRELREAADDPLVDAIVLRVNSPGGTPAAAQEIIGDLEYAKTKKPVVVSMGDIGTSAAYYVSAHADRIYANPDTFTAGVGVIWKFSDISRWMEKEGYNISIVKSGSKKDMGSTSRPLSSDVTDWLTPAVLKYLLSHTANVQQIDILPAELAVIENAQDAPLDVFPNPLLLKRQVDELHALPPI